MSIPKNPTTKKYGWIILAALIAIGSVLFYIANRTPLEPASLKRLDAAEAAWNTSPIPSYRLVVDVERPEEKRRNEVTVQDGIVTSATVKYWNAQTRNWDTPYDLNEDQSFPFTVPGLYDMLRGAIMNSNRADIKVNMQGEPAFPYRIVFGPVWRDSQPVSGTESEVIVQEFTIFP